MTQFKTYGRSVYTNGYTILPCQPNNKVPGYFDGYKWTGFSDWNEYSNLSNVPEEIDTWETWPDAGICVLLGKLVGVDIDVLEEDLSDQIEQLAYEYLGKSEVMRVGKWPKKMLFYKNASPAKKMRVGPVEILGHGQQAVAYGIHPDTRQPYHWPKKGIHEISFDDLIEVDKAQLEDFLEACRGLLPEKEEIKISGDYTPNANQEATFQACQEAITFISNSDLHWEDWSRVGMAIKGALGDRGLDLFMSWSAQSDKDVPAVTRQKYMFDKPTRSGFGTLYHMAKNSGWTPPPSLAFNPDKAALATDSGNLNAVIKQFATQETAPAQAKEEAPAERKDPWVHETEHELPPHLLEVDGLLGMMTDWINRTALIKQPTMALFNSLAGLSTVYGRKFAYRDRTRTNLYVLCLAGTATGKDHSRKQIKALMSKCGHNKLMMGETFNSEPGMLRALKDSPRRLAQVDEFGQFLGVVSGNNATSFQAGIQGALLKFYSSSGSIYNGADYADQTREPVVISYPSLSVYGTTTLVDFQRSLTDTNMANGFINRFITVPIFRPNMKAQDTDNTPPPSRLLDVFSEHCDFSPTEVNFGNASDLDSGLVTAAAYNNVQCAMAPREALQDCFDYQQNILQKANMGNDLANLWGRYFENIAKISMIKALSRDVVRPDIKMEDVEWARGILDWSLGQTALMIKEHASNSYIEGEIKKVLSLIKKSGEDGIAHRDLTRKTQKIPKQTRDQVIATLLEGEQVRVTSTPNPKGPPTIIYRIA
jgi:hypothetical protein